MSSNYYIVKEPCFQNLVQAIWQVDHLTTFQSEHIIPKGIVEIIFDLSESDSTLVHLQTSQYRLPNCFINGINTKPIRLNLPRKQVFLGVVFKPLATKRIFGVPAREFSNIAVDLSLLDPRCNSLWQQLAELGSFNERVALIFGWLKNYCSGWQPRDQLINGFLCDNNGHQLSVKELAGTLCYSPRQLSRKMLEATGMNTEEMLLYKKYLHAVHLVHHSTLSLTAIAHQSGFTDQSHFIRSFRNYTQMTPGAYRRNKGYVKGHMYENVR